MRNSRESFDEFISSRFDKGRYYTVKKMREIIENSDLEKCEKKQANKHIDTQYYAVNYRYAMSNSKKKIKQEKAFYNMLDNFEYLDISPFRCHIGTSTVMTVFRVCMNFLGLNRKIYSAV